MKKRDNLLPQTKAISNIATSVEIPESKYHYIGEQIESVDGYEKATGKAIFFSDLEFPGMLHTAILRSPYPHARIINIDTTKAEAFPGVAAVITAKDLPKEKYGPQKPDRNILAVDKVRFVGEEVAAVAAKDLEIAKKALSLIKVKYEPLPYFLSPKEAIGRDDLLIHDDAPKNIAHQSKIIRGRGKEAFDECDLIVEEEFSTQAVHCLFLEPHICVAYIDSYGILNIYLPVQTPFPWRNKIASLFDLPLSKIKIVQTHMGGAFGGKLDTTLHMIATALALKTKKPVKVAHTKDDDLASGFHRVATNIWMKIGAKKDGTLIAKQVKIIGDNGAYNSLAPKIVCTNMAIRSDCLYRYKHTETEAYLVYTNKVPSSAYRGYGNPQITFAQESLLDILARKLNMDPVELRLKNIIHQGDITIHGWHIRSSGLEECLIKGAEEIGWEKDKNKNGKMHGRGVACMIHVSGNRGALDWDGSETMIRLHEDGSIVVFSGESELGQGIRTVLAQITAEELGVPISSVKVAQVDTEISPFVLGPYSTKTTVLAGNATRIAAKKLKDMITKKAAVWLNVPDSEIRLEDGKIKTDKKEYDLKEFTEWFHTHEGRESLFARGIFDPGRVRISAENDFYGDISANYPLAAHFAEVEVDPETGEVTILNYVAAHDIGKVINFNGAKGQVIGGVMQGIGYAIMEEILYKDGKVANPDLVNYLIPTSMDTPKIKPLFIESLDPVGPYGAKGIGEPTLIPVAAAVANAIYDATGIRFTSIPITAEKIYMALKRKREKSEDKS